MHRLLIALFCIIVELSAQNLVDLNVSYLELQTNESSLDEVVKKSEQKQFRPLQKGHTKFGFTNHIFWLQVDINNTTQKEYSKVLEMLYPLLDYIEIYEYKDGVLDLKKELGDLRIADTNAQMPNPSYMFTLLPKEQKSFFIKVRSKGSINIDLELKDYDTYHQANLFKSRISFFYFGAVFIMLIYNMIIYIMIKNKSFLYYVLMHVSFFIFSLSLTGVAALLLWPQTPQINNYSVIVGMTLTGIFAILFVIKFLELKKIAPVVHKFLSLYLLVFFVSFVAIFLFDYNIMIKIESLLSLTICAILLIISLYVYLRYKKINALYFFLAWSFFLIGVIITHLGNIGLLPSTTLTYYSSQIGSFLELVLLSLALASYYTKLQNEHVKMSYKNQELDKLSNIDPLTNAYNRRYFYNHVTTVLKDLKNKEADLCLLMLDLDHFKLVNDKYGHDAGDKVLQSFANTCRENIRTSDIFVRFGGEEFLLFLPYTQVQNSISIAEKINELTRDIFIESVPGLNLSVSIGISYNVYDINDLVQQADIAMYHTKERGRDGYQVYKS